jgi:hypothetical protein
MDDVEDTGEPKKELNELFSIYRRYIEHEDNLINQRVTWFLTSQAFLFTIYGYYLSVSLGPTLGHAPALPVGEILQWMASRIAAPSISVTLLIVSALCYFGFFSSLRSLQSIAAGHTAVKCLREKWEADVLGKPGAVHPTLPDLTGGGSPRAGSKGWGVSSLFLPRSACWLWVAIFLAHLFAGR